MVCVNQPPVRDSHNLSQGLFGHIWTTMNEEYFCPFSNRKAEFRKVESTKDPFYTDTFIVLSMECTTERRPTGLKKSRTPQSSTSRELLHLEHCGGFEIDIGVRMENLSIQIGKTKVARTCIFRTRIRSVYNYGQKGGPRLRDPASWLSLEEFTQPMDHFFAHIC